MLNRIVTWDESWDHHYQTELKSVSVQWKHANSPSIKKSSAGNVMLTVFWDSQGVLLVYFQKRGENVNSASYSK
jgi:hypothetical protein